MKKLFGILLAAVMMFGVVGLMAACGPTEEATIALVTDVGTIDDESFNQAAWEGVKKFATDYNTANPKTPISYAYYQPSSDSTAERLASMRQAIKNGAKVIVCPGFLFEDAINEIQYEAQSVKFVLLDGEPHDFYGNYQTNHNVYNILYQEEQAGYLAGYAAVKDGFTKLGFLGGVAVPAVQRYGYGFVQGVDAAAVELGKASDVSIKYTYGGQFFGDASITAKMDTWYSGGTEVVFASGGGIYTSALEAAAKLTDKYVIGVDVDQSSLGASYTKNPFLTSAMKGLSNSVITALQSWVGGKWYKGFGGQTAKLGIAGNYVGLPTADSAWNFRTFTKAAYEELVEKMQDGTITVSDDISGAPTVSISVDYTA